MLLRHNLIEHTKSSKTTDLNVTQLILFNSPRGSEQICILGRQLGERYTTIEAYKGAAQKSYGHLMIGLNVRNGKTLRYSSNSSGDETSIFYCSTDRLYLNLDNELSKVLYS